MITITKARKTQPGIPGHQAGGFISGRGSFTLYREGRMWVAESTNGKAATGATQRKAAEALAAL